MRGSRMVRGALASAALAAVLTGCASVPQPPGIQTHRWRAIQPTHSTTSAQPQHEPITFRLASAVRDVGHALLRGVSWMLRPSSGVYGPPEDTAAVSQKTWLRVTGSTGCTSKCQIVKRNSVRPGP